MADYERRFHHATSARSTGPRGIVGVAAVFDRITRVRDFDEVVRPGAFSGVTGGRIPALFNHNPGYVLARAPKTMRLSVTATGLEYTIPELPRTRADVLEAIKRGDVTGSSFSFRVAADGERWTPAHERTDGGDRPLRELIRFAEVHDLGPVTFAAYSDATVSARAEQRCRELIAAAPPPWAAGDAPRLDELERDNDAALACATHRLGYERGKMVAFADPTELRRLAWHEAGHVVALWASGMELRDVRLDGVGGRATLHGARYSGLTRHTGDGATPVMALAGPAAERIAARRAGRPVPDRWRGSWGNDLARARDLGARTDAEVAAALDRAEKCLMAHWPAVRAVAGRLAEDVVLDEGEVMEIIGSHVTREQMAAAWAARCRVRGSAV